MLELDLFQPNIEVSPLNKTVQDSVSILKHQAKFKKISLCLQKLPKE